MGRENILIVDDEKNIRRSVEMICTGEGYAVRTADGAAEARALLETEPADLVLLDILMPGIDGLVFLREIHKTYPETVVIIISGHATVQNAVAATKDGAYDFIEKPISKGKLLIAIKNAMQSRLLQNENRQLRQQIRSKYEMIGQSKAIKDVLAQIARVAPTDGRVLILGESGTGKELIARAIHENSSRGDGPFVMVNCAAIPEELIESELFGSEKGAYTGAIETRQGKFSLANGGTLFLDEIGDMSLKVQAKVLRVLQEGEFEKVGGTRTEKVDVRVLAATNKNLEAEVRDGRFRDDLYFRLNVVPIVSPPLRQRRDDIPLLVEHFVDGYCRDNGFRKIQLTEAAMATLTAYDWPGNIRELRNTIERLIIMSGTATVEPADLPEPIQKPKIQFAPQMQMGLTLKALRDKIEHDYILANLQKNRWNISQVARELDIDRTNLHKKMKQYGICHPTAGAGESE